MAAKKRPRRKKNRTVAVGRAGFPFECFLHLFAAILDVTLSLLRWLLLVFSFVLAALGSLTVVKSPDWAPWKLAVLAGEYGHRVALAPILVASLAWLARGPAGGITVATVLVGVLAFGLLLRPCLEARLLARTLPEKLEKQFGRVALARGPFSFGALLDRGPESVRPETLRFSGELALDFYRPARAGAGSAPRPCVIVVHGGGWDGGDRSEIAQFNHWLAACGYAVAAIDYRLAPKFPWPASRDDVLAAIAFLKKNAATLDLDATRLVLFGRSAGGNLAEATAYAAGDAAIRGVIAFYAPADLHFAYAYSREDDLLKSPQLLRQYLGGPPESARAAYDGASGYLHVSKNVPPTLLVHGQLDPLVWHRQSERLDVRLTEHGVPHAFVSLPWATHAYEYNLRGPGGQLATFAVEWFLAAVTR
ncbi:MAG: alpha/beta hydrolase [Opitutus sp.]|nr:alpha/beta hydrolase [Opitutus sp.]